tara:strand:+ start:1040 stop:1273 length:234 start_codon:yes stop_codon:yes gene_type:complete
MMPNGCSFVQPVTSWFEALTSCCNAHDIAYSASGIPRIVADEAFYYCLQAINPFLAVAGFAAVSAFGWLFYKGKKHD